MWVFKVVHIQKLHIQKSKAKLSRSKKLLKDQIQGVKQSIYEQPK